jgi:hypothetical protein
VDDLRECAERLLETHRKGLRRLEQRRTPPARALWRKSRESTATPTGAWPGAGRTGGSGPGGNGRARRPAPIRRSWRRWPGAS